MNQPDFPSLARQPALACFIPKSHSESMLILNVFLACNLLVSEVINSNNEKWAQLTEHAKANTTKGYQLNAFNSALYKEEERKQWSETLGIMKNDKFTSPWKQAALVAKKFLEDNYKTSF